MLSVRVNDERKNLSAGSQVVHRPLSTWAARVDGCRLATRDVGDTGTVWMPPSSSGPAGHAPRAWVADIFAALAGLGFGATLALVLAGETRGSLAAPGVGSSPAVDWRDSPAHI